jgi:hypothetical protein
MFRFYGWLVGALFVTLTGCTDKEKQIEALFRDRPNMRVPVNSRIYSAAEKVLEDMIWRGREPEGNHASAFTIDDGELLLQKNLPAGEAWVCFFFESRNFTKRNHFHNVWKKGINGEFTRYNWVKANTELEYKAGKEFLTLLDTLLYPEFKKLGISAAEAREYEERFNIPFESWLLSPQDSYPWNYWGTYYDTHLKNVKNE